MSNKQDDISKYIFEAGFGEINEISDTKKIKFDTLKQYLHGLLLRREYQPDYETNMIFVQVIKTNIPDVIEKTQVKILCPTKLDEMLFGVKDGSEIFIQYTHDTPTQKGQMQGFKVFVK